MLGCCFYKWNSFFALPLAAAGLLQAQTNTGHIRGYLYDETGAVVPRATVTATDRSRGMQRQASTTELGEYFLSHLDPGLYDLRFEAENFAALIIENFEVRVGATESLSPQLGLAAAVESIAVSAEAARPIIEPEKTQQSDHIDSVSIGNLPINRRDYLDLALLTPGVVNTNYVVDDSDFRIAPTPQSGLGIGGTNGRGNTFTIDGVTNNYNSGGVRPAVSQEAVYEFQINRNSFSAELGGAPGGAVNIVTKSGTNELHGTLFGVLRNRRFQARNYFDPDKSAYTRTQSGVSVGGPIARNKTFWHSAFERLDRHESVFVPLLQDESFLYQMTPSQQTLANTLRVSAPPNLLPLIDQLSASLIPGNNPQVVSLFRENSGVFPFSEQRQQFMTRFDHRLGDGHNLFFRGNWTGQDNQNTSFGSLVAYSRGRNSNVKDFSLVLGDTYVISPQWVSETRLGMGYYDLGVYPTDVNGPEIGINGFGLFGRDFILPTRVVERTWQLRQNFIRVSGRHTFKFGADINPLRDAVRAETFFGGRFTFGEAVPLSNLIDNAGGAGLSQLIKISLQNAGRAGLAATVDQPISSLQAYALGLPIIYQQGFGDPNWVGWANRYNFFAEDSWRLTRNFLLTLAVRHEFENKTRFPRDNNNIGPRAGFAWSPNSKTVIRGGYGIFYSRIDGQVAYIEDLLGENQQIQQAFVPLTGLPGTISPVTGQPVTSAEIYQSLRGILGSRPVTLDDIAAHGVNVGPNSPLRVQFRVAEDIVNPYSQQGSFEIQRAVADYSFSAAYNFNRGIHLIRPLDTNVYRAGTNAQGLPVAGFRNPLILQDNVYGSWANSSYHALILQLKKRLSKGFMLSAHHTWSKTMDENTDYNSSFEPHYQWDAKAERALSSYHRGHRFVAHAVVQSPWKAGAGKGFAHNLFGDFTVSGIAVARSFAPFNLNAGFDNIGDRHTDTHRPHGVGRNIGIGPNFFTFDIRLSRQFSLGDEGRKNIQLVAEAFNLFNRTNFKNVNGTVGQTSLDELPDSLRGRRGPVTEPFSFTSAFEPRQFQFSLRFNF